MKITSRFDASVLFQANLSSMRLVVEAAVKVRADLRSANLRGADLRSADLGGANLRGADLWGANLRGADLRSADLGGANLGGANLRGADLWGANLGGADLRSANLGGANLGGANLRGANLGGADLGGANLGGANLGGANLGGADLANHVILLAAFTLGYIDSWPTMLLRTSAGLRIVAGCRTLSLEQAEKHYAGRANRTRLYYLATEGWKTIVKLAGWEE